MLKDLVDIGNVIRNAVTFNPRNWEGPLMESESLFAAVGRLFALLDERKVGYVLVGGIAMLTYIEGRNTQDIDLIMAPSELKKVPEIETEQGDNPFLVQGRFQGLQIDVLLTRNPLFRLVQQRYSRQQDFLGQKVPVATVEGLLLLKLYALPSLYRQGSFARVSVYENDVASLMYAYRPDMEALLTMLADYLGEGDIKALQEIVEEIEQRIRRFRKERGESD